MFDDQCQQREMISMSTSGSEVTIRWASSLIVVVDESERQQRHMPLYTQTDIITRYVCMSVCVL